ncbi:MAG: dienelactone hydrolase family protein [Candidatus Omnitrophota bacterium]
MKRLFLILITIFLVNFFINPQAGLYAHEEEIQTTKEGIQYAVRFPEKFKESESYPVLFCFHHRGDGVETTRIFSYAAYKLNWFIVGFKDIVFSDLDKETWPKVIKAQESVLKDVRNKYNVRNNRLYAAGFANGATMAYDFAYRHPEKFRAIIAFGGGLGLDKPTYSVAVYQAVGEDDFNLDQVQRADSKLKVLGVKSQLRIFKGGYGWPPEEIVNEALEWISRIK